MKHLSKIVIIGNGPAGNEAASIIRKHGNRAISMFSKESHPEYSACFLHDFISGALDRELLFLKNERDYVSEAIDLFWGRCVYEIDTDQKYVAFEGGKEHYDQLIIATGSIPIVPKIDGLHLKGVFTFKTLDDAENISAFKANTVVVVGGGPIGVEVSIALKRRGLNVYLIENEAWILSRIFEERLGNIVKMKIESSGIAVLNQEEVAKIAGEDKVKAVLLKSNNVIDCDMVVFAMGMMPNTHIARNAGLKLGDLGGIITDENMATSIPDIYACGDCIELKDSLTQKNVLNALWPNAVMGGKVAGLHAIGISRKFPGPVNLNCIQIYDLTAVSFGYSDSMLSGLEGRDVLEGSMFDGEYRMVLLNGNLVGMQLIAKDDKLIPLCNLVQKKGNFSMMRRAFGDSEFIMRNPMACLLLTTRDFHLVKNKGWLLR